MWRPMFRPLLAPLYTRGLRRLSTARYVPPGIPTKAVVELPRSVIAIFGRDSPKYLNGLITVRPPEPRPDLGQNQAAAYAVMLNAKGRILADSFVYAAHDNPHVQALTGGTGTFCYLLEVDTTLVDKIVDVLDFHVLMSEVEIKVLDNFKVWSVWNDAEELDSTRFSDAFGEHSLWTVDHRAPGIGFRAVGESLGEMGQNLSASISEYDLRRYLFGVPEGPKELVSGKTLPLDACIDYMGGIDFNKGCYLGQELTIRTHHHGTVRKRIAPIVLSSNASEELSDDIYKPEDFHVEPGTSITDDSPIPNESLVSPIFGESPFKSSGAPQRLRPAGAVISTLGNVGLAMIRLDKLGHNFRVDDYYVQALTPYWWPVAEEGAEAPASENL